MAWSAKLRIVVLLAALAVSSLAAGCRSTSAPPGASSGQVSVPDLPSTSPTTHYCAGESTYPNGVNVLAELLCNMVSGQDLVASLGPGAYRVVDGFTCRLQAANQSLILDIYIGIPGLDHWYQTAMSFARNDPHAVVARTTIARRDAVAYTNDAGHQRSVYLAIPNRPNAVVVLNLRMDFSDTSPNQHGREQAILDNSIAPVFVAASAR